MIISLLSLAALCSVDGNQKTLDLELFQRQDKNRDGLLTHDQFIEGLFLAFLSADIERSKEILNNFGREFLGEKDSEGKVELSIIDKWVGSGELVKAFEEWKEMNYDDIMLMDPRFNRMPTDFKRPPRGPTIKRYQPRDQDL